MRRVWVLGLVTVGCLPLGAQGRRFVADDLVKIVRVGDPQMAPDGRTISVVVGRANLKEDRWDSEIDFVDVASKGMRVMTHGRQGVGMVRWSPGGERRSRWRWAG